MCFKTWHQNRQCRSVVQRQTHINSYLILDKGAKNIYWRKDSLFNRWCWEKWKATCNKMKLNLYLSPCMKLNSKCIKDLGTRTETLHLTEEKVGPNIHYVGLGTDFLNKTKVQEVKSRINKWDGIKLKSCFSAKETIM